MAFGPSFGSLISSYTQNIMVIFYISVGFDVIYTIFVAFILPESMSPEALRNAVEFRRRSKSNSDSPWWKKFARNLLVLVAPFKMFLPRTVKRSAGRKLRDWNPTFLGVAFALHATNSVSLNLYDGSQRYSEFFLSFLGVILLQVPICFESIFLEFYSNGQLA